MRKTDPQNDVSSDCVFFIYLLPLLDLAQELTNLTAAPARSLAGLFHQVLVSSFFRTLPSLVPLPIELHSHSLPEAGCEDPFNNEDAGETACDPGCSYGSALCAELLSSLRPMTGCALEGVI